MMAWRRNPPDRIARADDERLLAMLAMRIGFGSYVVAGHFGVTSEYVRTATNRIRQDDLDCSGEDPRRVAAAYGWPR